ncbi:MAG: hypothetical protein AAF541_18685 [Pseudomonadota bacterium]
MSESNLVIVDPSMLIIFYGLTGLFFVVFAGVAVWMFLQNRAARSQLSILSEQLEVFTRSSIEVAKTVTRLLDGQDLREIQTHVSSRRWVVDEARARLDDGQPLDQVAGSLGLNHDEVSLLHRLCLSKELRAG